MTNKYNRKCNSQNYDRSGGDNHVHHCQRTIGHDGNHKCSNCSKEW